VNRDKLLAAVIVPAIVFAFVVGVLGLHRGYGLARAIITVALTLWIVYAAVFSTPFLNKLSDRARGAIGLAASALMVVEISRVIHIMATDGVAVGDVLTLIADLLAFGFVFAWGLGTLGISPGWAMYQTTIRANKTDPRRALRLATRTARLYRRWDKAWLLKASLMPQDSGLAAEIAVLKDGIR